MLLVSDEYLLYKGCKMKNKIMIIITFCTLLLPVSIISARSKVSFGTDITGEFPSTAVYNSFVNSLQKNFVTVFKHFYDIEKTRLNGSTIIIDEVENFTFRGALSSAVIKDGSHDDLNDLSSNYLYGAEGLFTAPGKSFSIGFSLSKKLSISLMGSMIPKFVGLNVMWKFYDNKKSDEIKNNKLKLFLSSGFLIHWIVAKAEDRTYDYIYYDGGLEGNYSFDNGNGAIDINDFTSYGDTSMYIYIIDIAVKLFYTYKSINLHAGLGVFINIYNVKESYTFDVNVKHTAGSPTGIDTTMTVEFDDIWVNLMPHLTLGFSFNLTGWLRFPIFQLSLMLLPTNSEILLRFSFFGLQLRF